MGKKTIYLSASKIVTDNWTALSFYLDKKSGKPSCISTAINVFSSVVDIKIINVNGEIAT